MRLEIRSLDSDKAQGGEIMYKCDDCGAKYHGNFGHCARCGGAIVILPSKAILPKKTSQNNSTWPLVMIGITIAVVGFFVSKFS
jgi:hypothetical protein